MVGVAGLCLSSVGTAWAMGHEVRQEQGQRMTHPFAKSFQSDFFKNGNPIANMIKSVLARKGAPEAEPHSQCVLSPSL